MHRTCRLGFCMRVRSGKPVYEITKCNESAASHASVGMDNVLLFKRSDLRLSRKAGWMDLKEREKQRKCRTDICEYVVFYRPRCQQMQSTAQRAMKSRSKHDSLMSFVMDGRGADEIARREMQYVRLEVCRETACVFNFDYESQVAACHRSVSWLCISLSQNIEYDRRVRYGFAFHRKCIVNMIFTSCNVMQ